MAYAENTSVSVEKSKAEIERTLQKYGAAQFISGWDLSRAMIGFTMDNRQIRFIVDLPEKDEKRFTHTPGRGTKRTESQAYSEWEKACRQRWRALALVIKAKLEAVESGITCFEDEFMAHIILPDGQTVGDYMKPQISAAYETKKMPKMLPYLK
jgi:hypothetical protein